MSYDLLVLRAIVRLSRSGRAATTDEILVRAGGEADDVRASLRRLAVAGLVDERGGKAPRLTLSGLAIAVSTMPPMRAPRRAVTAKRRAA